MRDLSCSGKQLENERDHSLPLEHIEVKNTWSFSFMTPVSLGINVAQSVQ